MCSVLENVPYALRERICIPFLDVVSIDIDYIYCYIMSFWISVASFIFCMDDLSIDVSENKSFLLLYYYQFISLCLLVFALCILVFLYCAYSLMGVISFSYIDPFIFVYCPFLYGLYLKSILSDVSVLLTLSCFSILLWNIFFHSLTFKLCISFTRGWISCRQYIAGSFTFLV